MATPRKSARKPPREVSKRAKAGAEKLRTSKRDAKGHVPKWQPTTEQRLLIGAAAACNVDILGIAAAIGVCKNTLKKWCDAEIKEGRSALEAKLCGELYVIATDRGNRSQVGAIMAILNNKFGWRPPPQDLNLRSKQPIVMNLNYGGAK